RRRTVAGADAVLAVYPDATRYLRPEALAPKRVLAAMGVRPSRRRGEGMEFESLRDYVAGDDPRRVDWAATARRGRLVTRLYQHERNHTVLIALDTSRALVVVLTDFVEVDAASLVAPLVLLARRHRVLLVAMRDRAYEALAPGADAPLDLYRRVVLDELLREREAALGRLRRGGLETVD